MCNGILLAEGINVRVDNNSSGWEYVNLKTSCGNENKSIWTGHSAIWNNIICTPLTIYRDEAFGGDYIVKNTGEEQGKCEAHGQSTLVYSVGDNGKVSVKCE